MPAHTWPHSAHIAQPPAHPPPCTYTSSACRSPPGWPQHLPASGRRAYHAQRGGADRVDSAHGPHGQASFEFDAPEDHHRGRRGVSQEGSLRPVLSSICNSIVIPLLSLRSAHPFHKRYTCMCALRCICLPPLAIPPCRRLIEFFDGKDGVEMRHLW
jgi:hypothetical protein